MQKRIEIQGHRGARGVRPENTLSAFVFAIEAGCDAIELDLMVTSDGNLVVHHDYFLNPKFSFYADGRAAPHELIHYLPLSEIQKIDCGKVPNPSFTRQQAVPGSYIPTLQDVFDLIKNHPLAKTIKLTLELKRDPEHPDLTIIPLAFAKKVLEAVKKNEFEKRVYYHSFDPEVLLKLRELDSKAVLGFISKRSLEEMLYVGNELNVRNISPFHEMIKDKSSVEMFHKAGFKVIPWTVNDLELAFELIGFGVDGLISDYPADLIEALKIRGLH